MATSAQAVKKFKSWLGLKEGPAVDKAIINPWNKATGCKPPAKSKKNPWCAIAAASCLLQVHAKGFSKSATCKNQRNYYKKYKRWIAAGQRPKTGDIIFVTGHEGMVTSTSATGSSRYISGNSLNKVRYSSFNWKTKKAGKKKVLGYGRPKYGN